MYKNGRAKKWISEAALQSLQNFHYQSKSTTRVLRKPTTSTAAPMDRWKMQKMGSEPFGPPFAPLRAPANSETASARSTRGGAVPRGPKGTCLVAGSHGGARAGSWCTAPWRASVHDRARAHVRRAGPQCKPSGFAPRASRSFGASIGPLGTRRVDLGRRWPKTFPVSETKCNTF